jgi:hypothetical protein
MFEKLEAYLEEISHFLSGRGEREEILSEIKSHILEKAEQEHGEVTETSLDKVIAAYGPARRVAEKYLDGHSIIAPAFKRYLFRYTSFLFAVHFLITAVAVFFTKSFLVFPFLLVPRMGVFDALFYLPTAFLYDLGLVTLILYFITRSKKEIKLPWPRFAVDLDEVKRPKRLILSVLGLVAMLAGTGLTLYLFVRYHSIFFLNLDFPEPRLLFTPEAGKWFSLAVITMFAVGAVALFVKFFTSSPWVNVVKNGISLVIVGLLFRLPLDNAFAFSPSARARLSIKYTLMVTLFFISIGVAVDFVKGLVVIGRKKLAKP